MKKTLMVSIALMLLGSSVADTQATADTPGSFQLTTVAEVEVVATQADGTQAVERVPAEKVVPGDEVIYTMIYHNAGTELAENVFITNPIPEHMLLLRAEQTESDLEITYSVDGGRNFNSLSNLQVTEQTGWQRHARASDCTHIRWTFNRPLEPGEKGNVSYKAQLQ